MYKWNIVPLCEAQKRDVNPNDIIQDGLYRRCNIYKGGGGYDKFSDIYKTRKNITDKDFNMQFVVQLQGCPLRCPYCYVTPDGIFGESVEVSTEKLVSDFMETGLDVFHLMGGAPALYINYWEEILERIPSNIPFHSDLLLVEGEYDEEVLKRLAKYDNSLYALSIKGSNAGELKENTGIEFPVERFWRNFEKVVRCKIPFYVTFTGMSKDSVKQMKQQILARFPQEAEEILKDCFAINLVQYEALK